MGEQNLKALSAKLGSARTTVSAIEVAIAMRDRVGLDRQKVIDKFMDAQADLTQALELFRRSNRGADRRI